MKYLRYDPHAPLGTRASAVHRHLRQLFELTGIDPSIPLGDVRQDQELMQSVLEKLKRLASLDSDAVSSLDRPVTGHSHHCDGRRCGSNCPSRAAATARDGPSSSMESGAHNGNHSDRKVLVLSDLHIPFTCDQLIQHALAEHADADEVVLLGDIWDMYAVSRFGKERQIDVIVELEQGTALILQLLERFPKVVVVLGNHDTRPVRWVERENPQMIPLVLSPLEYVRYRLVRDRQEHLLERLVVPEYTVTGSHPGYPVRTNYVYLVGDALLGHFEVSRKGPSTTVYRLATEWLPFWGPMVGAERVRALVQGHVHRLSKCQFGPYLLIESGCCAHVMGYTVRSPLAYSVPGVGYVVLYQKDGVTDFNRSGYYVYQEIYR